MQAGRQILAIFLIVLLLGVGVRPFFPPEDESKDSRVNLQDAILLIKNFERATDGRVSFTANMEKTISVFRIVAELKENISPPKDKTNISSDHFPAVQPSFSYSPVLPAKHCKFAQYMDSRTIEPEPREPVPRCV